MHSTLSALPVYDPMEAGDLQTQMFPHQNRKGFPVIFMKANAMAGDDQTYHAYGPVWANVSNTPFREFKQWVHEGGIATPLIAHWPAVIKDRGRIRTQPGHVIDIMATVVDVAGAAYPAEYKGNEIVPVEGRSLRRVFEANEAIEREALYFEHGGNRAIRRGKWKLVSKASTNEEGLAKKDSLDLSQWELFDMERDRTETVDVGKSHPELVKELSDLWYRWAGRTNTIPKP